MEINIFMDQDANALQISFQNGSPGTLHLRRVRRTLL